MLQKVPIKSKLCFVQRNENQGFGLYESTWDLEYKTNETVKDKISYTMDLLLLQNNPS